MKDDKFELIDLTADERIMALMSLLISKGVISNGEMKSALNAVLNNKNDPAKKGLKENQMASFILDMVGQNK